MKPLSGCEAMLIQGCNLHRTNTSGAWMRAFRSMCLPGELLTFCANNSTATVIFIAEEVWIHQLSAKLKSREDIQAVWGHRSKHNCFSCCKVVLDFEGVLIFHSVVPCTGYRLTLSEDGGLLICRYTVRSINIWTNFGSVHHTMKFKWNNSDPV